MPNNISKPLAFGEHAACITNTSIHSFGELEDRLQLSLLPFSLTKLSLIIYIRKYLNSLPFRYSAAAAVICWHRCCHYGVVRLHDFSSDHVVIFADPLWFWVVFCGGGRREGLIF
jgi:hypothetical protein